jgi:hypothetical protein
MKKSTYRLSLMGASRYLSGGIGVASQYRQVWPVLYPRNLFRGYALHLFVSIAKYKDPSQAATTTAGNINIKSPVPCPPWSSTMRLPAPPWHCLRR